MEHYGNLRREYARSIKERTLPTGNGIRATVHGKGKEVPNILGKILGFPYR